MILILNLSARPKGTSRMLSRYFAGRLSNTRRMDLHPGCKNAQEILDAIRNAQRVVFIGPCYVNTWPADTLRFLTLAKEAGVFDGQSVYGYIQGGMPYPHTHEPALRTLKLFCEDAGALWKGGFVMGGGAMLDGRDLEQIIGAKTMVPAVHAFLDCVRDDREAHSSLYEQAVMPMPTPVAFVLSKVMNRSLRQKMRAMGVDPKAPSPYQTKDCEKRLFRG